MLWLPQEGTRGHVELSPYSNRDSPDKIWFLRRARGDSHVERFIERLDPQTAVLQQLIRQTQWLHDEYERTR